MSRVLLVTNDYPPRRGGIQSYLEALVEHLLETGSADALTVYAPKWKGAEDYDAALRPPDTTSCATRPR